MPVYSHTTFAVFSAALWVAAVLNTQAVPYLQTTLFALSDEYEWFISGARADYQLLFILAVASSLFAVGFPYHLYVSVVASIAP